MSPDGRAQRERAALFSPMRRAAWLRVPRDVDAQIGSKESDRLDHGRQRLGVARGGSQGELRSSPAARGSIVSLVSPEMMSTVTRRGGGDARLGPIG